MVAVGPTVCPGAARCLLLQVLAAGGIQHHPDRHEAEEPPLAEVGDVVPALVAVRAVGRGEPGRGVARLDRALGAQRHLEQLEQLVSASSTYWCGSFRPQVCEYVRGVPGQAARSFRTQTILHNEPSERRGGVMADLAELLRDYSVPALLLVAVLAAGIFVSKLVVEQAITKRLDVYAEELTLRLGRRSAFEEKILMDRYTVFIDIVTRIERIQTKLNRRRLGDPVPEGLIEGNEVVPLTAVFEDLSIHEMALGAALATELRRHADLVLELANYNHMSESQQWDHNVRSRQCQARLRELANEEFGLDKITW